MKLQTAYDAYKGEIGITVLTIPVPALNNPEFYQVFVHQLHNLTSIKRAADNCPAYRKALDAGFGSFYGSE